MTPCDHEQLVVESAMRGRPTADVEAHLASCVECRELHETVRSMTALAADTERLANRRRLHEASLLWWKGQLARRWEAEARAVAPLDRMQRFEVGAGLLAALVLLASFFRSLLAAASGADHGFWAAWAGLAASSGLTWIMLAAVIAALVSAVAIRRLVES
jgi:hypothetical protein